jgi:hypothetical protein
MDFYLKRKKKMSKLTRTYRLSESTINKIDLIKKTLNDLDPREDGLVCTNTSIITFAINELFNDLSLTYEVKDFE